MLIVLICSLLPSLVYSKVLNHNSPVMKTKASHQESDLTVVNNNRKGSVSEVNKEKVLEKIVLGKDYELKNGAKFAAPQEIDNNEKEIEKASTAQSCVSRSAGDSRQGRLGMNAEVNLVMSKESLLTKKLYVGPRKTKKAHHKPKSNAELKRLTHNLKLAKVVLQLGVVVYKDVLPVVGALAISSRKMLKEKVIPAVVKFGHSASLKAGGVAERTMRTLRAYAPLVKDTLTVTLNTMVGGMRQASHEVNDVAQEFRKNYSSALAKMRARQAKEKAQLKQEAQKASSTPAVTKHRNFVIKGIVPR